MIFNTHIGDAAFYVREVGVTLEKEVASPLYTKRIKGYDSTGEG